MATVGLAPVAAGAAAGWGAGAALPAVKGALEVRDPILRRRKDEEGEERLYHQAISLVLLTRAASVSLIQRHLRIGYAKACRLLDRMVRAGWVSEPGPDGIREVLRRLS